MSTLIHQSLLLFKNPPISFKITPHCKTVSAQLYSLSLVNPRVDIEHLYNLRCVFDHSYKATEKH